MTMFRLRRWRIVPPALLVTLALAGCGSPSSSTSAPPSSTNSGGFIGNYPAPQDQDFQGCPPQGDGGDSQLNLRKNRIDTSAWQPTTVSSLVSLSFPSTIEKVRRSQWSSADAASVAQDEGRPVQADGYLLLVRHEGPESPNCHDPNQRDFHMWLAQSPGGFGDRATSLIVEVTPRSRALNNGWQPDSRLLGLTGRHVRISGWLMLDQEHPEQLGKTRGTLWEIHPVMKIEVAQNGAWVDLNDSSLTITGGSSGANGGYSGSSTSSGATAHRHRRHHHASGG